MDYEKEIPFGAFDSELMHQEISIPEGFTATIEGNKIILAKTESEDEKMLREIKRYIKEQGNKPTGLPNGTAAVADMLAWLEKQGQEPKKVSIWKHWKNGIAGNGEGEQIYLIKYGNTYHLSSCLSFECDYIELSELDNFMLEKQGEQKSFDYECANIQQRDFAPDTIGYKEERLTSLERKVKDFLFDFHIKATDGLSFDGTMTIVHNLIALCQQEHKPADWSEEDEKLFELSVTNLTELKDRFGKEYGRTGDCIDWLETLKERVQPQPKQKWSGDDKCMYDILCGTIKNTDINENTKYKLISWLKSIKQ